MGDTGVRLGGRLNWARVGVMSVKKAAITRCDVRTRYTRCTTCTRYTRCNECTRCTRCNECEEGGYYKVWSLITLTREAELWENGTFSALPIWSRDSFLSIFFVYIFCLRFVLFVSDPINQQVSPIAARHLVTIMTWPSVPIWKINASTNSYLGGRWSLSQNLHKTSIHKSSLSPESTKVLKK